MKGPGMILHLFSALPVAFLAVSMVRGQPASSIPLDAALPLDSSVTSGRLPNGLSYFIRVNRKPEKRAELRLVVNAGSVLEDDDQRGLAHMVEHMAFNGTRHFARQELVNYLESVGVRFGPDLNAYTSFDETVFMLQVPTDTPAIVSKGFDILEDWAHLISFDDGEIDRERGVVIEEWRLGRGAGARIRDRQFPVLFKDSRYAVRLPIGDVKILESFNHETLRRFYKDWYRPDLMAVVAVGDFDPARIEALIKNHFSAIPAAINPRPRLLSPVPGHDSTLFTVATDPEASQTVVNVHYRLPVDSDTLARDYRAGLALFGEMLNQRLAELARLQDPPFLYAYGGHGRYVRTGEFFTLSATVKEGGISRGLEAMTTEAARIRRFGFTATELERAKKDALRGMEDAYLEREKTESGGFADELDRHFLEAEPVPGIGYEYELYRRFLPGITLDEINAIAGRWITPHDRVVAVSGPEKSRSTIPAEDALAAILNGVDRADITAYVDSTSSEPLLGPITSPGRIVERRERKEIGVTELTLSNGVKVILKPTDFKNDEVLFSAFSKGGSSLVPDSNYIAALTASALVQEGGVGMFDRTRLQKKLAGKIVQVSPFIGELSQGMGGSASPQDLATMFELMHLYFIAPRADTPAFESYVSRMRAVLQNRGARPESAFEDTIQVTMGAHNFRRRPFTVPMLGEMNLEKSLAIYRDRFADASSFTFVFTGSFDPKGIEPLVSTYLATLPSSKRTESWRDLGIHPPDGVVQKTVRRGIEPKSQVRITFSGPFAWTREHRFALNALAEVLTIKLRESLREEKGGTYGVGVSATPIRIPQQRYLFTISFGCAPERVEELTKAAFDQIDSVKNAPPSQVYVTKVRETELREREVNLKQNGFWLSALQFCYDNLIDPGQILAYTDLIHALTPGLVQDAARTYLNTSRYARFILVPEQAQ